MADKAYSVVVMPLREEDGTGFIALVPELHGCMAVGDTREEAVSEIADAICEWVIEAEALGRAIPVPGHERQQHRQKTDAMRNVIKRQSELINQLRKALDAATQSLTALEAKDEVRFSWDFDCVDIDLPAHKKMSRMVAH